MYRLMTKFSTTRNTRKTQGHPSDMPPLSVVWVESVPPALRGSLSRWLVEPTTGVFVGRPPAKVRTALWAVVTEHVLEGRAVMLTHDSSELGASILMTGDVSRELLDLDGLLLPAKVTVVTQESSPHTRG